MVKISQLQLWMLLTIYIFTSAIAFLIGPLARDAAFDGWISILAGCLGGTLLTHIVIRFANRRPGQFLGDYGQQLVGKYAHHAFMLLFFFFYLHLGAYILREFQDFFVQTYLSRTPAWMISITFAFCIACLVRTGLEAVFRFAQGFFVLIMVVFLCKPLMIANQLDASMLIAFWTTHHAKAWWNTSVGIIPWYGELIFLLFIYPAIRNPRRTAKTLWIAALSGTYVLIGEYVLDLLLFGPELTGHLTYPFLEHVRYLRLGDFMENMDPILVSVWFSSLFVKIAIIYYAAAFILAQCLKLPDHRAITFPVGAVMVGLSLAMAGSAVELAEFFAHSWGAFALFVECLPFVYALADLVRYRRSR